MIECFSAVCTAIESALEQAHQAGEAEQVNVAIDGMCGSGKSTLGEALAEKYGGNLFHTDDFFLRPEQRTPERYAQPGGNVDYERFQAEVLEHLADKNGFSYRRFDCHAMELGEIHKVSWNKVNIIEGAYSSHPYFGDFCRLCFFLEVSPEEQKKRILARNGEEMWKRFEQDWIPMENHYFEFYGIREKCIVIP
ncbi:MAG: AAA family ATPase [Lachnospiraceae bacterium]|nr:AAA family ATPase [Lachnospiraceae bacterium]